MHTCTFMWYKGKKLISILLLLLLSTTRLLPAWIMNCTCWKMVWLQLYTLKNGTEQTETASAGRKCSQLQWAVNQLAVVTTMMTKYKSKCKTKDGSLQDATVRHSAESKVNRCHTVIVQWFSRLADVGTHKAEGCRTADGLVVQPPHLHQHTQCITVK